jgi:hypothetical protein
VPSLSGGHQHAVQHYSFVKLGDPWWSPKDLGADSKNTKRYPVQVSTSMFNGGIYTIVLANDNTLWYMLNGKDWYQLPTLPQPNGDNND